MLAADDEFSFRLAARGPVLPCDLQCCFVRLRTTGGEVRPGAGIAKPLDQAVRQALLWFVREERRVRKGQGCDLVADGIDYVPMGVAETADSRTSAHVQVTVAAVVVDVHACSLDGLGIEHRGSAVEHRSHGLAAPGDGPGGRRISLGRWHTV